MTVAQLRAHEKVNENFITVFRAAGPCQKQNLCIQCTPMKKNFHWFQVNWTEQHIFILWVLALSIHMLIYLCVVLNNCFCYWVWIFLLKMTFLSPILVFVYKALGRMVSGMDDGASWRDQSD